MDEGLILYSLGNQEKPFIVYTGISVRNFDESQKKPDAGQKALAEMKGDEVAVHNVPN